MITRREPAVEQGIPDARAKTLPKKLPLLPSEAPALVPARMLNEVTYCERLLYLEWAQGEFADNAFTVEGRVAHARADVPSGDLPPRPASPGESAAVDVEERPYRATSVWLSSERLGITAKIDVVEGEADGTVVAVEYKRGTAPDLDGGAYLPERVQVCAQVLLLREHGYVCDEGSIYFAASRRRVPIRIDDWLITTTLGAVTRAREIVAKGEIPPPLIDSPKCDGCSLAGICLPDEVVLLRRLAGEREAEPVVEQNPSELHGALEIDPWGLAGGAETNPLRLRNLVPARDDALPLYVQEQGSSIGLDGDRLLVRTRQNNAIQVRLSDTSQVVLFGNVQVTTQALRAVMERGIPITFHSRGGWFLGRASGIESKNVELRVAQHRAADDPVRALALATTFVAGKIRNSRTMLRRNHADASPVLLGQLEQLAKKAEHASSIESLLGIEGTAAREYFGAFTGMIKGEAAALGTFDMEGRNRRPPRDPVNALLSLAYSMLSKDLAVTLASVGLDPLLGFLHQPRFGRPALALDLMEELRPIVADSVVIGAINTRVVTSDDFVIRADAASLSQAGRRNFLLAYERRMDQLVTHPLFGYRISYRRVLEVQARLLSRVLMGELESYPVFRTR